MSRPFSYHDEDMDVIGNILFIHSHIPYATHPGVPMVRIPPEVLKRITETRNVAFVTSEFIAGIRLKTFKEMIIHGLFLPQPEYEYPL